MVIKTANKESPLNLQYRLLSRTIKNKMGRKYKPNKLAV